MNISRSSCLQSDLDDIALAAPGAACTVACGPENRRKGGPIPLRKGQGTARGTPVRAASDLEPKDLATLAVLGIVNEGFGTFSQVVSAARALARPDWQPTADMLAGAVQAALQEGLLTIKDASGRGGESRLAIRRAGTNRLRALLRQPLAQGRSSLGRTAAALKICFLGALDRESGCEVLEDLSGSYRGELEAVRHGRGACPAGGAFPCHWIDREIERIEQEVAWLERLQAELRRGAA